MSEPARATTARSSGRPEGPPLTRVWEPLTVGAVTLKNRIAVTPLSTYFGENGLLSQRHIAYYRERARGGAALIATEQQLAHRHTEGATSGLISAFDRRSIPILATAADAVHEYGCALFAELLAPGVADTSTGAIDSWHPVYGPSFRTGVGAAFRVGMVANEVSLAMDQSYIDELCADFAQSALNVKTAGGDGATIHGAHGYLPMQFLSPHYNKRTDRYGGSERKRCQFALDLAETIRKRVGANFTLGIRLSIDEFKGDAGLTESLMLEHINILAEAGLYDFFDISCGGHGTVHRLIRPMGSEDGYLIPQGKRVKEVVGSRARVFLAGRIRTIELAERALAEGAADVVGMGRAHIADPDLVRKSREGRSDEIVHCIGANECSGGQPMMYCVVNPATGREARWGGGSLRPAQQIKRIVVAGGGPAGMKLAGVAAARGHRVTLFESANELGGHLNLLKRLPTRDDWQLAIDDMARAMDRNNVDVRLGSAVAGPELISEKSDLFVCATGSRWVTDGFAPGPFAGRIVDLGSAVTAALSDPASLGARIVIADESGSYLPLGLAETLAQAGCRVDVVTRQMWVGAELVRTHDMPYLLPRLVALKVGMLAQSRLQGASDRSLAIESIWGGTPQHFDDVDTVVVANVRLPNDGLAVEARQVLPAVVALGDALAPRQTAAVIYEAEKLAREI